MSTNNFTMLITMGLATATILASGQAAAGHRHAPPDYGSDYGVVIQYRDYTPRSDFGFYYYDVTPAPRVLIDGYRSRFTPSQAGLACRDDDGHRHGRGHDHKRRHVDHRRQAPTRIDVNVDVDVYERPIIYRERSRW